MLCMQLRGAVSLCYISLVEQSNLTQGYAEKLLGSYLR
jgi:hypothetical protein